MKRTKVCVCGKVFSYEIGRGKDREYCSKKCSRDATRKRAKDAEHLLPECSTPWCSNRATRKKLGICEACYMRLLRKGTTDYKQLPYRIRQSAGYIWVREPSHPLATSGGLVYEHRFVFYNKHGKGPFKCHWCGKKVDWSMLHIDHLDDDNTNNNISNLVASCPQCNQGRGNWKMIQKRRDLGRNITYKGKTKPVSILAKERGMSVQAFKRRLKLWPLERVMEEPKGKTGPNAKTKGESKRGRG